MIKLKEHRLRLCRAEKVHGGFCRAWATNNGYCWYHHLSIFGVVMWGEHQW